MAMIHDRPVCFECDHPIESLADAVFSPPYCDHSGCASAVFHGLCLMAWREKREEHGRRRKQAQEAFLRHLTGQCDCADRPRPE